MASVAEAVQGERSCWERSFVYLAPLMAITEKHFLHHALFHYDWFLLTSLDVKP